MKTCNKCLLSKPLDAFANNRTKKDGKQGQCKDCRAVYYDDYYKNNPRERQRLAANRDRDRAELRTYLNEVKAVPCTDCGIQYPPYVMDFDHLGDKEFNISTGSQSRERVEQEIEKCEVVCANCHRIRTHARLTAVD